MTQKRIPDKPGGIIGAVQNSPKDFFQGLVIHFVHFMKQSDE
jgi:hypothetical protein